MIGSRPIAHHNKIATASETILRGRFLRTYLRKKLRSDSSMALSLRPIGKVLIVTQALHLALVGRQFVVRDSSGQGRRRHISSQHLAQSLPQILNRDVALNLS